MKVLGIVGSPRRGQGNTFRAVERALEGAAEGGAEVRQVCLSDLRIAPCCGCGRCMTEGRCPQADDVGPLQEEIMAADGLLFGSPVYLLQVSAQAKAFLDRCCFWAHRPSLLGRYCAAVAVTALTGEREVAAYINAILRLFGANPVGEVGLKAPDPTALLEGEALAPAFQLGQELARAIAERREHPISDRDRRRFQGFKAYILRHREVLRADYEHWKSRGWLEADFYLP